MRFDQKCSVLWSPSISIKCTDSRFAFFAFYLISICTGDLRQDKWCKVQVQARMQAPRQETPGRRGDRQTTLLWTNRILYTVPASNTCSRRAGRQFMLMIRVGIRPCL